MILIKRFNEQKTDLKINDKAISLNEVPKTVCTELGIPNDFPGYSFFDNNENKLRRFYFYTQTHVNQTKYLYLEPLSEYEINGFSWFDKSWKKTGKVFQNN